jgi:hypothetical protein
MSRETRLGKRQALLAKLEIDYVAALKRELQRTIDGRWGLFGQNDPAIADTNSILRAKLTLSSVTELLDAGSQIAAMRTELIMEPFHWHERLLHYRAMIGSNVPGESRQAATLLDEIESTSKSP